jgi:hypothetical protein
VLTNGGPGYHTMVPTLLIYEEAFTNYRYGNAAAMPATGRWAHARDAANEKFHVYWIGGTSGAGKSTTAARLANEHGLHLYATDEAMSENASRTTAAEAPFLHQFMAMSMDEPWGAVTATQIRTVVEHLIGAGQHRGGDQLVLVVADTGYDPERQAKSSFQVARSFTADEHTQHRDRHASRPECRPHGSGGLDGVHRLVE